MCSSDLPPGFVRPQNRLLGDVGGVQLRLETGAQLGSCQQPEVIPIPLQRPLVWFSRTVHEHFIPGAGAPAPGTGTWSRAPALYPR